MKIRSEMACAETREGAARIRPGSAFFNPLQEFQRDIGVLAAAVHTSSLQHVRIIDCCAGCGIRAIRYKLELPEDKQISVCACDASAAACEAANDNVRLNRNVDVQVICDDSKRVLASAAKHAFDVVEIDPCGSIAPFLAVAAMCEDALLILNSTDSKVLLSGSQPQVFFACYGVFPEDVMDRQELAIRVILGKLAMEAAGRDRVIVPKLCYATDFNVRLIVQISSVAALPPQPANLGFAISREGVTQLVPADAAVEVVAESSRCGPLWIGALGDPQFISNMQIRLRRLEQFKHSDRIQRILDECQQYLQLSAQNDQWQFVDVHALVRGQKGAKPSIWAILDRIRSAGHLALARTSAAHTTWLATDMQIQAVKDLISQAPSQLASKKRPRRFRTLTNQLVNADDVQHQHRMPTCKYHCLNTQPVSALLQHTTTEASLCSIIKAAFPDSFISFGDIECMKVVADPSEFCLIPWTRTVHPTVELFDLADNAITCILVHGPSQMVKPFHARGNVALIGVETEKGKASIRPRVGEKPCWTINAGCRLFLQDIEIEGCPTLGAAPDSESQSNMRPRTAKDHFFHVNGGTLVMTRCTISSECVTIGVFGGTCVLDSCDIRSDKSSGLYASSKSDVQLSGTVVHDCAAAGVSINNGSKLIARDCRFEGNQASGVYARSAELVLERCTFSRNCRCGIECFKSCEAHVCMCQANENGCSAVLCADSSLTVCSSEISRHGMAGVDVRGSTARAKIYNSSICGGKRSGLFVSGGASVHVDSCRLADNRRAIEVSNATLTGAVAEDEVDDPIPAATTATTENSARASQITEHTSSSHTEGPPRKRQTTAHFSV